jgi:cell division septation protein DedD
MRPASAYEEEEEIDGKGADLNLGMGTLIGIFFGLALVCGVFFGFGYMIGHRSPGPYVSAEPLYESPKPPQTPVAPKPSAQVASQPATQVVSPAPETPSPVEAQAPPPAPATTVPVATPIPKPAPVQPAAAPQPTVGLMVQIAAVKDRADAEALANALRTNGFSPTIRNEPQDKLLHVQLGPFANRDDAKAMRQRLSNAGYNAFIK